MPVVVVVVVVVLVREFITVPYDAGNVHALVQDFLLAEEDRTVVR